MKNSIVNKILAVPRKVYIAAAVAFIFIFTLLVLVPETICITGLNSLEEASEYARTMPELPPMENTNLVRPDYDYFYRANTPGYFTRKWRAIACCLNLPTRFDWPSLYFRSLLDVMLNRFKSYRVERDIVYKMSPAPKARFVIFGDLYGAYHSLVRDLEKLKELNIINDSLKIIAADTYILFMGSTMSRSPYGMETLGLVLRLMEMNADTAIYLRGNHEDNKYWEAFGLKEQYEIKCGEESKQLIATTNNFFMHLPLGLYLAVPNHPGHFIKISYLASSVSSKLKEDSYAHFLEAKQNGLLDKHEISEGLTHNSKITIEVAFQSEKKRQTFQSSTGLRQLPADGGVTTWTLMSAPTLVMQKGLQFTHDAFAIIQLAAQKGDWIITEYSQDAIKKDGFKTTAYQFFTGARESEKQVVPENDSVSAPVEAEAETTTPNTLPIAAPVLAPIEPTKPESNRLTKNLQEALDSNFVQLLAGHRKKRSTAISAASTAEPVVQTTSASIEAATAVLAATTSRAPQELTRARPTIPQETPLPLPLPPLALPGNRGNEVSITVGTPVQDPATRTMTLPLMVTIKDANGSPVPPRPVVSGGGNHDEPPLIKVPGV